MELEPPKTIYYWEMKKKMPKLPRETLQYHAKASQ